MDDIAKAASLSKGGVYFHFKSKQEVFSSLVQEEFDASMEFLERVTAQDEPIMVKLQTIGQHYVSKYDQATDAPRFFIVMGEMALRDSELSKKLLEMQTTFIKQIAALLEQGAQEGLLREVDYLAMAAVLKALSDVGEGLNALEYPMEATRYLGTGMDLILNGLAKRD